MTAVWLFARLTVAAAAICGLIACQRAPDSVDGIIAHHTHAIGGTSAIESVNSIEFQLHIVDPGFEVDATYRAIRPGRMRIDVVAGGRHVVHAAFNGAV